MRKQFDLLFTAIIIPALILSACGQGKVAASDLERMTNPDVPAADLDELEAGNTAFAFDLYQAIRGTTGNLVYSPYSISLAFAMTYAGARGETATQMASALHYTLPEAQFHPAFNALDLDLARRPEQAADVDQKDRFQLTIANALWGQNDWPFIKDYLDLLALNYGAGMRLVDFETATESARKQINNWVSDRTNRRIRDIIPPGVLDPSTRLVLANAIYFKATWQYEFDANSTEEAPFTLLSSEVVNAARMWQEKTQMFPYAAGDGWQAIAIPYKGGLTEMVIIVPEAGKFLSFESSLTAERYNEIVSAMQPQDVSLSMPKFKFDTTLGLKNTLTGMGMSEAFDRTRADFSGMDGQRLLYIGDALHKAFIAVDEKGTEAAAATVVIMMMASLSQPGIVLSIDRPFFFFIRDVPSGTVLFMGRVVDPR